jgi:hypothetical protein
MRPQVTRWMSRLTMPMLTACLGFGVPVDAGAQAQPSDQVVLPAPGPRLGSVGLGLRVWTQPGPASGTTQAWDAQIQQVSVRTPEVRRSGFSARGAMIGAAIGCAVGAIAYYDSDDQEPASHRLAKTAFLCGVVALPGAYFGAIFIR